MPPGSSEDAVIETLTCLPGLTLKRAWSVGVGDDQITPAGSLRAAGTSRSSAAPATASAVDHAFMTGNTCLVTTRSKGSPKSASWSWRKVQFGSGPLRQEPRRTALTAAGPEGSSDDVTRVTCFSLPPVFPTKIVGVTLT